MEIVYIPSEKNNIVLIGDGIKETVISNNRSFASGFPISSSATLNIDGPNFIAMNLTVQNTAGAEGKQAVALRSNSPNSAFYLLEIKGYQDTLYIHNGPQFYRECTIFGTVDFIFGEGPAFFQKCQILARQALPPQENALTANGRLTPTSGDGFAFQLCNITGDEDLLNSKNPTPTFLGRPWKAYSRTVFLQSYMSSIINSQGWLRWNTTYESTLFYAEFKNQGAGAVVNKRVNWPGVHSTLDIRMAEQYTVSKFISGDQWIPNTGIPFDSGLYI
ncbi:probable pectinesterase/pectinesterase inhibitor 44 [Mercurialis annua]|uniref:probable pectinesterase/pectinesterase inhibitor 44 n=1 Tax=Mercurialis annua TaxID=3986 RepID=UPI0021610A70|nr:probable pectinesterase/pectinesterase inhibitor 44 [Mercurialis annua]